MWAAAKTGAPLPWVLVRAMICETFGCLPSVLEEEPADDVLLGWQALKLFESHAMPKVPGM